MDTRTPSATDHLVESDSPLAYNVEAAGAKLGLGRTTTYAEVASGRLRSFRVGKRRLVPAQALVEYIADRMAEEAW